MGSVKSPKIIIWYLGNKHIQASSASKKPSNSARLIPGGIYKLKINNVMLDNTILHATMSVPREEDLT